MQKKIILIITILLFIMLKPIFAAEKLDITADAIIKYKWYIEEEDKESGTYYQKGKVLEEYYENPDLTIYGKGTASWDTDYCTYNKNNYLIEYINNKEYRVIADFKFIKFSNINYHDNELKVFINNKEVKYNIYSKTSNELVLELEHNYSVEDVWIYIDTTESFDITLLGNINSKEISLYKHIESAKILIPDKTWITKNSKYVTTHTSALYKNNDFRTQISNVNICRAVEIKTYRYKKIRKYYDNEYHEYIEGYIPDKEDYIIEYQKELPTKTINITKVDKEIVPIKEYIYLDNNISNDKESIEDTQDNNQEKCLPGKNGKVIETKYIENEVIKEVYKVPKYIYLIILLLIITIILMFILKNKKNVDWNY